MLRKVVLRCLAVWAACAVAAFCCKDLLFSLVFAPAQSDFVLYRGLCRLAQTTGWQALCPPDFTPQFINTELASQFMTHIRVAAWGGLLLACPFLVVQLYGFIAPALYRRERRWTLLLTVAGTLLFALGVLLSYFLIFPFSFRFLSTYQVQPSVVNQIALSSYISAFLMLSLLMGILFEIPVLAWVLGRIGIIDAPLLRRYRRHAFVVVCIAAAVITPTADAFTLLLVALPVYLLYEASILLVPR